MLGFFRLPTFTDPELGALSRSRGRWRGQLALEGASLPLAIAGSRGNPDADALDLARILPTAWSRHRDALAQALMAHYAPYQEALAPGEAVVPLDPVPTVARPSDVWPFVTLRSASVAPIDGRLLVETALAVAWDEEHTLSARFDRSRFVELNGSILEQ